MGPSQWLSFACFWAVPGGEEGAGKAFGASRFRSAPEVDALISRLKFRERRAVFTVDLTRSELGASHSLPESLEFKELVCSSEQAWRHDEHAFVTLKGLDLAFFLPVS